MPGPIPVSKIPVLELPHTNNFYPESPLGNSSLEQEVRGREDALYNQRPPQVAILHEKPEHRLILMLKLEGKSNREVARIAGYTPEHIGTVVRQPWFQKRLLDELKLLGGDGVSEFLRVQLDQSLLALTELRDNACSESVRFSAAKEIIDRVLGKTVQRSEVKMDVRQTPDKVADIDKQIAELEEEEKLLMSQRITV